MYVYRDKAQHIIKFDVRCRQVVTLMFRSFSLVEENFRSRAGSALGLFRTWWWWWWGGEVIIRPLPEVEPCFVF